MVTNLRLITQHVMFFVLTYGGRFGIQCGHSLPCFSCSYVSGCGGSCYLMALQGNWWGLQMTPANMMTAMGVHPLRLGSGCFGVGRLSASRFPVLMCPLLKATMGMLQLQARPQPAGAPRVVPTTCDWVVKFQELADGRPNACFLELPHLRQGEKGQQRWLEEI